MAFPSSFLREADLFPDASCFEGDILLWSSRGGFGGEGLGLGTLRSGILLIGELGRGTLKKGEGGMSVGSLKVGIRLDKLSDAAASDCPLLSCLDRSGPDCCGASVLLRARVSLGACTESS